MNGAQAHHPNRGSRPASRSASRIRAPPRSTSSPRWTRAPGVRGVLAQFEGVATGAADGYGRMARQAGADPGSSGARVRERHRELAQRPARTHSGLVNVIGHHPTWHRNFDPPLNTEVESLARGRLRLAADRPPRRSTSRGTWRMRSRLRDGPPGAGRHPDRSNRLSVERGPRTDHCEPASSTRRPRRPGGRRARPDGGSPGRAHDADAGQFRPYGCGTARSRQGAASDRLPARRRDLLGAHGAWSPASGAPAGALLSRAGRPVHGRCRHGGSGRRARSRRLLRLRGRCEPLDSGVGGSRHSEPSDRGQRPRAQRTGRRARRERRAAGARGRAAAGADGGRSAPGSRPRRSRLPCPRTRSSWTRESPPVPASTPPR